MKIQYKVFTALLLVALTISALGVIPALAAGEPVPGTAVAVWGQGGSFTSNTANNGGISADSLSSPFGVTIDSSGNVYVADTMNNRVLYYPAGSATATRVYGQNGSFTSNTANNGGVSATSLYGPESVALDSSGNVYIADSSNSRVLYYAGSSTTATRVYGQGGSFTNSGGNNGGISATSLFGPRGLALDSGGGLYVADYNNNRVLYYPSGNTTASRVYGQAGSFTTNTANNGGLSANSLNDPFAVAWNAGGLYVTDSYNHRVLYYAGTSTTATRVYGQGGSFTTNTANNGGVSAASLNNPFGLALDSMGGLYTVDSYNNRVLYYPSGSTTATRVYGQGYSLTSNNAYSGAGTPNANGFYMPIGVALDGSGNLYVVDYGANRVLKFRTSDDSADDVYGQGGSFTTGTQNKNGLSADSLAIPYGVLTDGSGNVYIADSNNNRVLYYPAGSTTATRVYGQPDFASNTNNNGGVSANSLYAPNGMVLDSSGNLYIADHSNNRVLYYPSGSTTATRVYGQPDFVSKTANNGGISANTLSGPTGLALDGSGGLYVADESNNRVLYYPSGSTTATRVYGQPDFVSKTANNGGVSANSFFYPLGVAVDGNNNLYVADYQNNRVLYFASGSTTATRVYGQAGSFTTNTLNNGGISATSLASPAGLVLDTLGGLFIADLNNNRVLYYPAGSTTATRVYGQGGNFTIGAAWSGTGDPAANNFFNPFGLALDKSGNLYVVDDQVSRVLKFVFGDPDTTAPTVTAFGAASSSTNLNIPITSFTASDIVGVTSYLVTNSSTKPAASAAGWASTAPTTYIAAGDGPYTLYPWAKDAGGNVSAVYGSPVSGTVTRPVPTVTFGTAPAPAYLGGDFTVSATTTNTDSSALTYSVVSGPCALVSGATFSTSGAGTCVVQASGAGTTNFAPASQTQNVIIAKATPTATLVVSNSPLTYDGSAHAAIVIVSTSSTPGAAANITTGGAASQINVGTYAVVADFVPTDTANFTTLTGLAVGNFTIDKATPTVTLVVSNSPVAYDGAAHAATVTISAASTPGAVANVLTGGAASQTAAGTYPVLADFIPTDTANYNSLLGQAAGNFVIGQATPVITFDPAPSATFPGPDFTVAASTTNTDSPVLAYSVVSGPCTLNSGATFTPTGTGDCIVQAAGVATANFLAGSQNQTVTIVAQNAPTAVTKAASGLRVIGAILNGTVNAQGDSAIVTFEYGPTTAYGKTVTAAQSPVTGSTDTNVSAVLTGLTPNTTYHFRVVAQNTGGTTQGGDMTFKTSAMIERLKNAGFETYLGTSKVPLYWTAAKFAATDGKSTTKKVGKYAVQIVGKATIAKTLSQTVTISGVAGDPFNFSVWVKGTTLAKTGICQVQVILYNGAVPSETKTVNCPTGTFAWKQLKIVFNATKPYTKAVIKFTFKKAGTIWFDVASLKR